MQIKEFYVYQLRVDDQNEPFYIGKGKGNRAWSHLNKKERKKISHKRNTIEKAYNENKEVLVEILESNLNETDAFILEIFYISKFGRRDLNTGCLTNQTDGGEGLSGISDEERNRRSIDAKKQMSNPINIKYLSDIAKIQWKDKDFSEKQSERAKANMSDPRRRELQTEIMKKYWINNDAAMAHATSLGKRMTDDKVHQRKMCEAAAIKNRGTKQYCNPNTGKIRSFKSDDIEDNFYLYVPSYGFKDDILREQYPRIDRNIHWGNYGN